MPDILNEIIAYKRVEVERLKEALPEKRIHAEVEKILGHSLPSFKEALLASESGIIAEFKRRSPSKGWIKESGRADEIPLSYQQNGASAVSILTDEKFFGGCDAFITSACESGVTIPVLYKNFVIDEYQLFQARLCGASAVLLIASALAKDDCRSLLGMAHELGLEVLLEMHGEQELDYADLMPDAYGVNNRNLGTFVTDVQNSFHLAEKLPEGACKVSESGISDPRTVCSLRQAGYNGFLVGENFMKTEKPGASLRQFICELSGLNKK